MLQLAILGGSGKTKDMDSFLQPLVDEMYSLSTKGMIVQKAGVTISKARVHLMGATGKI